MFANKIKKKDRGGEKKRIGVGVIVSMVIIFSSLVCDSMQDGREGGEIKKKKKGAMNETPGSHVCSRKQFPRLNLVMQSLWASSAFGN